MYQPILKNRGDFAANNLQDIQTIYLSETYATLQNPTEITFASEQILHWESLVQRQFSVLECRTFYWKRLNYLLEINYPANAAFLLRLQVKI